MNNPNPVKIVETVLRDGHQSICATRMRTSDMLPVLEALDDCGFYALEAWGGATFDSCLRFLNEDPWERLRTIRSHVKNTKLQMLLRGQNLLGYNHYADDVVTEFIKRSVANGIDIVRVFDAFNDTRNLECSMKAIKEAGAHAQGTLVYTISPYHKDSDFVKLAKELHRRQTGKTFYILDEPTTGLHTDDVRKLLEVLQRLVDTGNTVVVIEHNLDVIKTADYIIDLGPEGGVGGGTLVACGTPEEIAACPASYTGQYLKSVLDND